MSDALTTQPAPLSPHSVEVLKAFLSLGLTVKDCTAALGCNRREMAAFIADHPSIVVTAILKSLEA